jgi:hypothetical protein
MLPWLPFLIVPTVAAVQQDAPPQPGPRLEVDDRTHDFGRVEPDAEVVHRFRLTNSGGAALRITRVIPGCGCTSALAGSERLEPGQATDLTVTFDPAGYSGPVTKFIDVFSDDPAREKTILVIKADVRRAVQAAVDEVWFRDLAPGDDRQDSVRLRSGTGQPLRVTGVDLSPAPWLGVATRQEGLDQFVDLELLARRLPRRRLAGTDTIDLHVANPDPRVVHLSVHWQKRLPVRVEPERIALDGEAGQEHAATLTLSAPGGRPFRILSARSSSPLVQVTSLDRGAGPSHRVQVVLSPAARAGSYTETATLELDTPGRPTLELRVSANLR